MQNTPPSRNPQTQAAHRRESWLQIGLPLLLGILVVLGLAGFVVVIASRGGNVSQGADTSLIFILIPMLIIALVISTLLGGLIYLMAAALKALPPKFFVIQGFFYRVQDTVQNTSDKLVEPAMRTKSAVAAWGVIKNNLSIRKATKQTHVEGS